MEVSDLKFNKLKELVKNNQIEDVVDKEIADKLVSAERDWRTTSQTILKFIQILEKEAKGPLTKSHLSTLMARYQQNSLQYLWEIESLSYILDIFDLTTTEDLEEIIINFIKRITIQ